MKTKTTIQLNRCLFCRSTTITAVRNGTGLRLVGACKTSRTLREITSSEAAYAEAHAQLLKLAAEEGPYAEDAKKLLAGLET